MGQDPAVRTGYINNQFGLACRLACIDRVSVHDLEVQLIWACPNKAGNAENADIIIVRTVKEISRLQLR
jgi:hypothetical protein